MPETTEPQLTEVQVAEIEDAITRLRQAEESYSADRSEWYGRHQAHARFDRLVTPASVDALIRDWGAMKAEIERFESPDGEGKCRFCGNLRDAPHGHVQKCYCIPTIRQYREENAALREQLAQAEKERELCCWHCGLVLEQQPKLRCERCPDECDVVNCDAFGCVDKTVEQHLDSWR